MAINSVPNASNTQLNQTSIGQSGGEFQDATVTNDNTASQSIDAPIWAQGKGSEVLSAPQASNTQLNLTNVQQEQPPFSNPEVVAKKLEGGGPTDPYSPGFQTATVTNSNTLDQSIFAPVDKFSKDVPPEA